MGGLSVLRMGRTSRTVLRISVVSAKGRALSGWRELRLGSHCVTLKEVTENGLAKFFL